MLNTRDRQSYTEHLEHQSDTSSNETTPLRDNTNSNGIRVSSVEVESSENSIASKIMDSNSKQILFKIGIDLFLLCCGKFQNTEIYCF